MNMNKDVFAQMKNEDRKFGEREVKKSVQKQKRDKHAPNFKNMTAADIMNMAEEVDDEVEFA